MKFLKWWIKELPEGAQVVLFFVVWLSLGTGSTLLFDWIVGAAVLLGIPGAIITWVALCSLNEWVRGEYKRYKSYMDWEEEEVAIRLSGNRNHGRPIKNPFKAKRSN